MKILIFMLISLCLLAGAYAYIGRISPYVVHEGTNMVTVTLHDLDEKELTLSAKSDLFYDRVGNIRIDDTGKVRMYYDIPEGARGYYPVLLRVQNENIRESKKAWIYVE